MPIPTIKDAPPIEPPSAAINGAELAGPHPPAGSSGRQQGESPREPAGPASGEPGAPSEPARRSARAPRSRRAESGARRAGTRPPRAEHPAPVPAPEHRHLPGWVRRAHARARPPLGDLLVALHGEARESLRQRLDELTAGISSGKFSLAFQYPAVVDEGRALYERQRAAELEAGRTARQLEGVRRRAAEEVRDASGMIGADAAARLQRELRGARDPGAVAAVRSEAEKALSAARSSGSRRRDREIDRTRQRIRRTGPRGAGIEPQAEPWQDVLRRFAEQHSGDAESDAAASS